MEMIEQQVKLLQEYKSKMEYQNLDLDGDRPAQNKKLRIQMATLYEGKDMTLFGPVKLTEPKSALTEAGSGVRDGIFHVKTC